MNCTSDSLSIIFASGLGKESFRAQVREGNPMLDLLSTFSQLKRRSFFKKLHFQWRDEEVLQRLFRWRTQRKLVLIYSRTRLTLPVQVDLKFAARGNIQEEQLPREVWDTVLINRILEKAFLIDLMRNWLLFSIEWDDTFRWAKLDCYVELYWF